MTTTDQIHWEVPMATVAEVVARYEVLGLGKEGWQRRMIREVAKDPDALGLTHSQAVRLLYENGADFEVFDHIPVGGRNAYYEVGLLAIEKNDLKMLKYCYWEKGFGTQTHYGRCHLSYAAERDNWEIVKYLDSVVHGDSMSDPISRSIAEGAASGGHYEMFVKYFKPNRLCNSRMEVILSEAIKGKNVQIIDAILGVIGEYDAHGVLYDVASGGSVELYKKFAAMPNFADLDINTYLQTASLSGRLELVKYLVSQGATDFTAAAACAMCEDQYEVFHYLRTCGKIDVGACIKTVITREAHCPGTAGQCEARLAFLNGLTS